MRTQRLAAILSVATLGLTGCGFHGLYGTNLPGGVDVGSHPYSVTIEFRDVLDLVPQSNVKVNDVAVGKVKSISLDGWNAKVTVQINKNVHLPANARAAVQQTSLLGEKYVNIAPPIGQAEGTLADGAHIPISRTGTAPEVEEVLGALSLMLNGGGFEQIRTITTELNKALHGNEKSVRDLIGQLNTFVGSLDKQKDDITTALVNVDKLAATLNRQKQTIINTLDTLPQAITILKDDRSKLTTLLGSLARLGAVASRVVNSTQATLVASLKSLAPVLESLTATGSDLPKAFKILLTFPFPLGATKKFAKGDYANLNIFLDFNLGNELCGLNQPALCELGKTLLPASAKTKALTPSASTSALIPNTTSQQPDLLPVIPGAGG
jgi:phospholipid/cholesterol/gamma-HCH transport system substrate-binding protein